MKRELKFRAWYDKSQSWVYFNLNEGFTHEGYKIYQELIIDGAKFYQFTGLYDKNGKEIYEGDILCWPKYEGTKNQSRWTVEWDNERCEYTKWHPKNEAEVIGNIHQNPELL